MDPDAVPPVPQESFREPEHEDRQPWERLGAHLRAHGMALSRTFRPRQFAGGFGNLNYLIRLDGRWAVLRRPPPGPIPPGANDMGREYRILAQLWRGFPLAPRALHYCADAAVLGARFLIMEHRPGRVIRAELPGDLAGDPATAAGLGEMLVDILVELHRVEPASVGLADLGRPQGFLARALHGWSKRAGIAWQERPPALVTSLSAWLGAHAVPDGAPTLLHNDFKLDNVVLDPAGAAPRAVLDWDMGSRGDPLFDLATLLSYWTEAGDPEAMQRLRQMPSAAPGFPDRRAVVERYARRSGRDVSDFRFHRVLAMFKLAVVFQQLYRRYLNGDTRDPRFAGFGAVAAGLLEFTHDIAHGSAF